MLKDNLNYKIISERIKKNPWAFIHGFFYITIFILLIRYQFELINFLDFGDEAETLVASKMMASGKQLYTEIFNHHGPLTFFFSHFLEVIGDFGISEHRVTIIIFQLVALFCIWLSPITDNNNRSIITIICATVMILGLSEIFGHMYLYQTIAGLLILCVLVQFILPDLFGKELSKIKYIIAGILLTSLPFLAITYLPFSIISIILLLKKNTFKTVLLGCVIGIILNLLYLSVVGSITGFIAYHIYLNSTFLPNSSSLLGYLGNIFNLLTTVPGFFITLLFILSFILIPTNSISAVIKNILVFAAMFSLLLRGGNGFFFHHLPFLYGAIAFIIPIVTYVLKFSSRNKVAKNWGMLILSIFVIINLSLFTETEKNRSITSSLRMNESEFSRLVKAITDEDDEILCLSFQNHQYLYADRLPISAHFFYLPFQAYYNANPILGIKTSLADDINRKKPKIIFADKWKVWDTDLYAWNMYAQDIDLILNEDYFQIPNKPYYIRNDLDLTYLGVDLRNGIPNMKPIGEMIDNVMYSQNIALNSDIEISGMNIMFATFARNNNCEIIVKFVKNNEVFKDFKLNCEKFIDNRNISFIFDKRVKFNASDDFKVIIETQGASYGNAVTIWLQSSLFNAGINALINNQNIDGYSFVYSFVE